MIWNFLNNKWLPRSLSSAMLYDIPPQRCDGWHSPGNGRALLCWAAIAVGAGIVLAEDEDALPQFKITTKRDTDAVEVTLEKSAAVFSIHSPFGISQAVIERTQDAWPDAVTLRLHLQGLERFQVTNGKTTLEAAVALSEVRLWKDGQEDAPLTADSPYWTKFRLIGRDDKPATAIPLKNGYIEVTLPKAFFKDNPKSITVNWIDFYRV